MNQVVQTYATFDEINIPLLSQITSKEMKWIDISVRHFDELMRLQFDSSVRDFCDTVINQLANYCESPKVIFFLADNELNKLNPVASFGCEKEIKSLYKGENFTGEAYKSGHLYILENLPVPSPYFIESAFTKIYATDVFICPLIFNQIVFGVIEFYFTETPTPKIFRLLEFLSRNIATMLQGILSADRTKKLLVEIQYQAVKLKEQEAVMKRTIEELETTQEEMHRRQLELETVKLELEKNNSHLAENEEELRRNLEDLEAAQKLTLKTQQELTTQKGQIESLLNSSNDLVTVVDKDYKLMLFNNPTKEYFDVRGIQLFRGMSVFEITSEDERQTFISNFNRVFKGENFEREVKFSHEGFDAYYLVNYFPVRTDQGEIIGMGMITKDITEKKHFEYEEYKQQRRMEIAQEIGRMASWEYDHRFYRTSFSENISDIFEADRYELETDEKPLKRFLTPENFENLNNGLRGALNEGQSFKKDTKITLASNREKWVRISAQPMRDDKSNIIGIIGFIQDITEQKLREIEIQTKNTQLTDSIRYAQRMQNAILPSDSEFAKHFSDYFVLFQPKDIVSGDFYWLVKVEAYTFVAVVDCTGHGVPGAFMSIIGNTILNEAVIEKHIHEPCEVLNFLQTRIRQALKQDQSDNTDGMDLCLCRIKNLPNEKYSVTMAGSKSIIYYSHNQEFNELKGDRISIGGDYSLGTDKKFTNKNFALDKGDLLYLLSDGCADVANKERKRYSSQRLRELIFNISQLSLTLQKEKILEELRSFQGNTPQRDDMTLIGLKL